MSTDGTFYLKYEKIQIQNISNHIQQHISEYENHVHAHHNFTGTQESPEIPALMTSAAHQYDKNRQGKLKAKCS